MRVLDKGTIELSGIDTNDYPDFSDSYITYAEWNDGTPLSEEEIDSLGSDVVYEAVLKELL